ncbi:hypothetical protein EYF80_007723 [Liparis tanakae]|uniref:Uncharacterized protein n=1 Tax=Liparis tanakae TaxID=230148 RepID=A0A4Z2IWE2_9TELE|nr:hypothetical protein EYF80_007723 [Liparis tanakae]
MATTYPGIAYEQQQQPRRRICSQSQNTNDGREKPSGVSRYVHAESEHALYPFSVSLGVSQMVAGAQRGRLE